MPIDQVRTPDVLHLASMRMFDAVAGEVSVPSCGDLVRQSAVALDST